MNFSIKIFSYTIMNHVVVVNKHCGNLYNSFTYCIALYGQGIAAFLESTLQFTRHAVHK